MSRKAPFSQLEKSHALAGRFSYGLTTRLNKMEPSRLDLNPLKRCWNTWAVFTALRFLPLVSRVFMWVKALMSVLYTQ